MRERPFFSQVLPKFTESTGVTGSADSHTLLNDLEQADADEQLEILQNFVQSQVIQVLGLDSSQPPDVRQGLTDIGMDSLMAVELSNRLKAGIKQSLPTTVAFEHGTIEALTTFLAVEVIELQTVEPQAAEEKTKEVQEEILAELEHLSETEIEDSLLKELEDAGY